MTKPKITLFLLTSLAGLVVGYLLTNSVQFGICTVNEIVTDASCINFYERVGDPIFYGMFALSLVFLILTFIPQSFPAWKKFAIWFTPIATLIFIFYSEPGSGDLFSPYPEQVFKWVSILYVVISIFVIYKSLKKE